MVVAVAFAAVPPCAQFDAGPCTVQAAHAALASPQAGPPSAEELNEKPCVRLAFVSGPHDSCALHSHAPCVQILSKPGLASRILQRPFVPAPPVGIAQATVFLGNSHSGTEFASRGALSPLRFGQTRSSILRC